MTFEDFIQLFYLHDMLENNLQLYNYSQLVKIYMHWILLEISKRVNFLKNRNTIIVFKNTVDVFVDES